MTANFRANLGEQRLAGEVKRHRHRWARYFYNDQQVGSACLCGVIQDEKKTRAGRSARNRGNRRELELAKVLGGEKVGMYGGPEDVRLPLLNVQSKVRKGFPYWMTAELDKLPRSGGRLPALVITDSPGSGIRRRSIVVLELADFVELHGKVTP